MPDVLRDDCRSSRASLGHGHDVECHSRAVLKVRLVGGFHPDHSLQQHVEHIRWRTGDGQNLARRGLGCVGLRRQESELMRVFIVTVLVTWTFNNMGDTGDIRQGSRCLLG